MLFLIIYSFPVWFKANCCTILRSLWVLSKNVSFGSISNHFVPIKNVYFVCHCRRCWSPSPVYVATATWLWHHREAHQAFGQLLPGGNPQDWRLPVWGGHQTGSMSSPGQQVPQTWTVFALVFGRHLTLFNENGTSWESKSWCHFCCFFLTSDSMSC